MNQSRSEALKGAGYSDAFINAFEIFDKKVSDLNFEPFKGSSQINADDFGKEFTLSNVNTSTSKPFSIEVV